MKILILEDDHNRVKQFNQRVDELNDMHIQDGIKFEMTHVETAEDCIKELEKITNSKDKFDLILLDHDLGGQVYVDVNKENTGSGVARWIEKNPEKILGALVITHTFNPAGAKNILNILPNAIHVPSIWVKEIFHKVIKIL